MSQLVVVLDENDSALDLVAKRLEDAGYLVLPLSTPDGLVDELKETQAAALLLDLQVSAETSGMDILAQIEHDTELESIPVLVYSTDAGQLQQLQPQLHARGYGILHKPFQMDEVLEWLQECVGTER
jgi:DNA-binding NtrC family response regulator